MNRSHFSILIVCLSLSVSCGKGMNPTGMTDSGIPPYRGLLANPRLLAFTCVTPGCDTTLKVNINSTVNRRIAIKRVVLSQDNADFTLTPSERAPFILGAASDFSVEVKFKPNQAPMSQTINLLVTYTDAVATEDPSRIEAGELVIPLVQRLVGEPILSARPGLLDFGVVDLGTSKKLMVTARNDGFGNLSLSVDKADGGRKTVRVDLPINSALIPDASVDIPVTFSPTVEEYLNGEIEIASSTPNVTPVYLQMQGTSHQWPKVTIEPEDNAIEFGEVPKGQKRKVTVQLVNYGGRALNITNLSVVDTVNTGNVDGGRDAGTMDAGVSSGTMNVTAKFPLALTSATLAPLTKLPIEIELNSTNPGIVDSHLRATTNDPQRGMLDVPIRAVVSEPKVSVSPATINWGTVPMGWVVSKRIEIKNVGYGKLKVKRVNFVGGTSQLYTFKNLPTLPLDLDRDRIAAFEIDFRAETGASFMGAVSVETDDVSKPFAEVALEATGGSCTAGCPIANGMPSCSMGTCSVGSCNTGWYNTNNQTADGCECQEIGTDPGLSCSSGVSKGTLSDRGSGASTSFTGILHSGEDIDFIRFYGEDASQTFSDNYDVKINITTSDPNIVMCVYRYPTGTATNDCFEQNETCGTTYRQSGSLLREDGAVYSIKVFRKPNTAGTCTPYTVYMSNG
jgi:hypothetical protein